MTISPDATVRIHDTDVKVADLPEASVLALLGRGISHVLGNEVASRVSTAKKATNEDGTPKYNEAELDELHRRVLAEKINAILEGTLGVRAAAAPKATAFEKRVRDIAITVLRRQAAAKGYAWPSGKGSGDQVRALVDQYLGNERYRAAAETLARSQIEAEAALAGGADGDEATDD